MPVVLYGFDTWSLTLREVSSLRLFENRVLRRVFGTKRSEETGGGENYIMRSLMNCSAQPWCVGDKIKNNEMGAACSACGERVVYRFLVVKPEGNGPLGRPRTR